MIRTAVLAATVALSGAIAPSVALAQQGSQPAPAHTGIAPGTASIIGAVTDSLHGGPLARAGVTVMQLPARHTVTSDAGAFRIDSIPPGRYTLEVTHPVLDSLGIRLLTDTVALAAGSVQTMALSIPGARLLTSAVCTPARLRLGPGVILGRVVDAVTEQPAVGAEVSVAWAEVEIGSDVGVRSSPRVRKATVSQDGTYRICGVPATFSGSLQAIRGNAKTAEVPIEVSEQTLSMRVLYLPRAQVATTTEAKPGSANGVKAPAAPAAAAAAAAAAGNAVIRGKVTNAGGVPVSDARVTVQGTSASAATSTDGSFTLTGVPAGTQAVLVRRVGYAPVEVPLDVKPRVTNDLTVRLGRFTPQLSRVEVTEKRTDLMEATGFDRRRKSGMGRYLTQEDIDKINPTYTSDALRRIPGLYVAGSGNNAQVYTTRGNGCVNFIVDRNPTTTGSAMSIDDAVNSRDVAAVEFYQPVDAPLELTGGASSGCALVVIWTKGQLKDLRTNK